MRGEKDPLPRYSFKLPLEPVFEGSPEALTSPSEAFSCGLNGLYLTSNSLASYRKRKAPQALLTRAIERQKTKRNNELATH